MVQKTAINLLIRFNNSLHSAWKDLFYYLSSLSSVSLSVIYVCMYLSCIFISNSFLNLIFLKSAGQLFYPSCLHVSLSHAFSLLASSYPFFLALTWLKWHYALVHSIVSVVTWSWFVTTLMMLTLIILLWWSTRFFCCKVYYFTFYN